MFQFHMVRLKGLVKRVVRLHIAFQFHMVRLKVRQEGTEIKRALMFQFHMVRLKAGIPMPSKFR